MLVTAPSGAVAVSLARTLVEEQLIACANLVPQVRSIYRWEGKVCDEEEVLLLLKTSADRFEALRARVLELHPAEVPELLRLEVSDGSPAYLAWVLAAVTKASPEG